MTFIFLSRKRGDESFLNYTGRTVGRSVGRPGGSGNSGGKDHESRRVFVSECVSVRVFVYRPRTQSTPIVVGPVMVRKERRDAVLKGELYHGTL